jgi:hypothetical protein
LDFWEKNGLLPNIRKKKSEIGVFFWDFFREKNWIVEQLTFFFLKSNYFLKLRSRARKNYSEWVLFGAYSKEISLYAPKKIIFTPEDYFFRIFQIYLLKIRFIYLYFGTKLIFQVSPLGFTIPEKKTVSLTNVRII